MSPPSPAPADPRGDQLLALAADGDPEKLAALRARVLAGEPAPYVAGFFFFRGLRFAIDDRAYVTDPEAAHLVEAVLAEGDAFAARAGRPPRILEFGTGAGVLALAVKHARPEWTLLGLDIDRPALALAAENALRLDLDLYLFQSDHLDGWPPGATPPDLVFGDPPWGDATDLYDDERDERYYLHMPARAVFPGVAGRTGIHDAFIRRFVAAGWPGTLLLNYGILPASLIEQSAAPLREKALLHPRPGLSILRAQA